MESKYIEIGKIIYLPEIGSIKCIEMTMDKSCSDCALNSDNCMEDRVECPLGIFKKLVVKIENEE